VCQPLDADSVADFEIGIGVLADGDDHASTFVATDLTASAFRRRQSV
jgi:hypothetical protein